ncbi:MAG: DJ-1/PfpI family protein, partial [Armatimonadota bacterium]
DYDAVVFVGGTGATEYFDDPTAHALAKQAAQSNRLTAAICLAPSILARAGLLQGKRATVYASEAATLEAKGADYTGAAVERDGNILTGEGPHAAKQFSQRLVEALAE